MQLTPLEGQVCLYRIIQDGKLLDVARAINRIRETIRAIEAKIITKLKHHYIHYIMAIRNYAIIATRSSTAR